MSFKCLQFLPKNEQNQVDLMDHSSKVEYICSFFGRIEDTEKSFNLHLKPEHDFLKMNHLQTKKKVLFFFFFSKWNF